MTWKGPRVGRSLRASSIALSASACRVRVVSRCEAWCQASGLKREFFLSQLPVPGTISVEVDEGGQTLTFEQGVDWTYDASRNSVTLTDYVPTPLAKIQLDYDVLAASEG